MEMNGLTKRQWGNAVGGGVAAWIYLGLTGVPVVGGIGVIVAIVGGIQLLRIKAAEGSRK